MFYTVIKFVLVWKCRGNVDSKEVSLVIFLNMFVLRVGVFFLNYRSRMVDIRASGHPKNNGIFSENVIFFLIQNLQKVLRIITYPKGSS